MVLHTIYTVFKGEVSECVFAAFCILLLIKAVTEISAHNTILRWTTYWVTNIQLCSKHTHTFHDIKLLVSDSKKCVHKYCTLFKTKWQTISPIALTEMEPQTWHSFSGTSSQCFWYQPPLITQMSNYIFNITARLFTLFSLWQWPCWFHI